MRFIEVAVREVRIVGPDERHVVRIGEIDKLGLAASLSGQTVTLQLDVKAAGKRRFQDEQRRFGGIRLPLGKQARDRPAGAACEADQALIRRGEIGRRHGRLGASLAVEVGSARQPDQVAVAGFALRQQDNAVRLGGVSVDRSRHAGALATGDLAGGERDFDADDRLNTGIGAGNREFERAEQIACIGDRHRRHRIGAAQLDQLLDLDRARRQRIGAVRAQMNEIGERHAGMIARTGLESSSAITGSETWARFAAPEAPLLIAVSSSAAPVLPMPP